MKRKFKILIGILGVFILAGATFGAYKLGQKQIQPPVISSQLKQCDLSNTEGVYSCAGDNFKVISKLPGGGFTLIDGQGKEIIRCGVVTPQYIDEKCKNLGCSSENLCELISTPAVSCGSCPQFVPPHPDFCKDGTIIPGEKNECGCQMLPRCEKTSGQKVFCQNPRPQVCTMECIQNPPFLCGSDGKSYCSTCQACSDKRVSWYITQDEPCGQVGFNYRELCGKPYQNQPPPCPVRQIYKCQDQFLLKSSCADGQDIVLDSQGNFLANCGGIAGYSPECKSLVKCAPPDFDNDLCRNY